MGEERREGEREREGLIFLTGPEVTADITEISHRNGHARSVFYTRNPWKGNVEEGCAMWMAPGGSRRQSFPRSNFCGSRAPRKHDLLLSFSSS